jgi:phosphopantothenoylcysteine synthetase/decarboxylase
MSLKNKRVLLTYGPTWVPIDGVRVIGNISTGELGKSLAFELFKKEARLTILEGPVQNPLKTAKARIHKFVYFNELFSLVRTELSKGYDIFIHAAAVSDYRVKNTLSTKLSSDLKGYNLSLVPTPKIIRLIKKISPDIFLVGFKLESSGDQNKLVMKAAELVNDAGCDLVVANTFKGGQYKACIIDKHETILGRAQSRMDLTKKLISVMEQI